MGPGVASHRASSLIDRDDQTRAPRRPGRLAAGHRPFKAARRVRLPLGLLCAQGVGKPGNPPVRGTGDRRFESGRRDREGVPCRPVIQRENTRPITARRRFDSSRADSVKHGIEVLAAARPALNRVVRVRAPPVPLGRHWSSSGEDTAPVMRQRGFESHPVLSVLFDNPASAYVPMM
jgi:hypothetical protein